MGPIRGQDVPWKALVDPPLEKWARRYDRRHDDPVTLKIRERHQANREYERGEEDMTTPTLLRLGL